MIENFAISSKSLYSLLKKKEVPFLYHANTVATALTFLNARSLLSRHQVEADGLAQSSQISDEHDKKYDVWDHVYVDGTDHHVLYSRPNNYGPVLFRLNLELLTSPLFPVVYIMRSNPLRWIDKMTLDQKFYTDIDEIDEIYLTKKQLDSQTMFTFRNPGYGIKLNKFLHSIGIDEPEILLKLTSVGEIGAGNYVRTVIGNAMKQNGLGHIPLMKRHNTAVGNCRCWTRYNYMYMTNKDEFRKRFVQQAI